MPRNLVRRVEVAFPVEAPELRKEIIELVLPAFLKDNVKARRLPATGLTNAFIRAKARRRLKPSFFSGKSRATRSKSAAETKTSGQSGSPQYQSATAVPMKKKILVVDIGAPHQAHGLAPQRRNSSPARTAKLQRQLIPQPEKDEAAGAPHHLHGFPAVSRMVVMRPEAPRQDGPGSASTRALCVGPCLQRAAMRAAPEYHGGRMLSRPRTGS